MCFKAKTYDEVAVFLKNPVSKGPKQKSKISQSALSPGPHILPIVPAETSPFRTVRSPKGDVKTPPHKLLA